MVFVWMGTLLLVLFLSRFVRQLTDFDMQESQLLETTFLTIFLVPLLSLKKFPRWTPTPIVCIWGNRWLLFRIMIGAGLIKIRGKIVALFWRSQCGLTSFCIELGDECWRDLTCMNYHYQTQPVPNPLSPLFHASPGDQQEFRPAFLNRYYSFTYFSQLLLIVFRHFSSFWNAVKSCDRVTVSLDALDATFVSHHRRTHPSALSGRVCSLLHDQQRAWALPFIAIYRMSFAWLYCSDCDSNKQCIVWCCKTRTLVVTCARLQNR